MKIKVDFLFCNTSKEFKEYFKKEFLGKSIKYQGIPVTFAEDDFLHIFFEHGCGGVPKAKFGQRRARRMLIIKQLFKNEIPYELLFERKSGNYCLLCECLEMAVFIKPVVSNKTLQIGTLIHYGTGSTKKIKKQRDSSTKVKGISF